MAVHKYTTEQHDFISEKRTLVISELVEQFNNTFKTQLTKSQLRAYKKNRGWLTGRTGRFEKGHIPSPNAKPKGPNRTSFKKGQKPKNWKPIGSERVTTEGYRQVKITDTGNTVNDYVELHRIVWEEHNGSIPNGHIVVFKDGNPLNCNIENLMLMKRAESVLINKMGLSQVDAELKETVHLLVKNRLKIIERSKEEL